MKKAIVATMAATFVLGITVSDVQAKTSYTIKNNKLVDKKTKKPIKGIVKYNNKFYKNGVVVKGYVVYKNHLYNKHKLTKGYKLYDKKMYLNGNLYTGIANDKKAYKKGAVLTGAYQGKQYVKGSLANGIVKNVYYKKGVPYTGTVGEISYVNGVATNAAVTQFETLVKSINLKRETPLTPALKADIEKMKTLYKSLSADQRMDVDYDLIDKYADILDTLEEIEIGLTNASIDWSDFAYDFEESLNPADAAYFEIKRQQYNKLVYLVDIENFIEHLRDDYRAFIDEYYGADDEDESSNEEDYDDEDYDYDDYIDEDGYEILYEND